MGLFARGLIEWTHPSSVRPSASAESRQIRIFKHYLCTYLVPFFVLIRWPFSDCRAIVRNASAGCPVLLPREEPADRPCRGTHCLCEHF